MAKKKKKSQPAPKTKSEQEKWSVQLPSEMELIRKARKGGRPGCFEESEKAYTRKTLRDAKKNLKNEY